MFLLPTNLAPVADLAGNEDRYSMHGVRLAVDGKTYEIAATDGKRLIVVNGHCIEGETIPETSPIHSAPNGECISLVPAKAWKESFTRAAKLKRPRYKSGQRCIGAVIGKNVTSFAAAENGAMTFDQPANVEGRFPAYRDVLPKRKPYASFRIDPKLFAETLKAVSAIGTDDEHKAVIVEVHRKDHIVIRAEECGQQVKALVVGLCNHDGKESATVHLDAFTNTQLQAEIDRRAAAMSEALATVDAE